MPGGPPQPMTELFVTDWRKPETTLHLYTWWVPDDHHYDLSVSVHESGELHANLAGFKPEQREAIENACRTQDWASINALPAESPFIACYGRIVVSLNIPTRVYPPGVCL